MDDLKFFCSFVTQLIMLYIFHNIESKKKAVMLMKAQQDATLTDMNNSLLSNVEVLDTDEVNALYEEEATFWNQFVDQIDRTETNVSDPSDRSNSRRCTVTTSQI